MREREREKAAANERNVQQKMCQADDSNGISGFGFDSLRAPSLSTPSPPPTSSLFLSLAACMKLGFPGQPSISLRPLGVAL